MIPQIKPIGRTEIDFSIFLQATNEALGCNILKGVDGCSRQFSEPAKFLASLSAFHKRLDSQDPIKAVRNAGSLLRHVTYIFLIYCDQDLISDIRERTQLNVTSTTAPDGEWVAVISGNLFDFRTAVLECCVPESSFDIRYLFDIIILYFESVGLGDLWFGFRKKTSPDKTFLLEHIP